MVQAEDADRRGEAFLSATCGVDFGGKGVEGSLFLKRDGAEGIPELGFQRNAGAMAVEGEGVFGGAGGHGATVAKA